MRERKRENVFILVLAAQVRQSENMCAWVCVRERERDKERPRKTL